MSIAFIRFLNLSITATLVAVAVLLLRLCMRKAPKWISVSLWAFVGARLVFPFAMESRFSIIPSLGAFEINQVNQAESFKVYTGMSVISSAVSDHITSTASRGMIIDVIDVLSIIWIAGVIAFILYGIISYMAVYLKVRTAIPLRDNIYQSENVRSPFVLGFIKPRIIVPFNLDEQTLQNVIMHENAHLKRKDHIVKPFAYLLLCFHWFNPVLWLSYILLCRDIEVACDEKVINKLTFDERKSYAMALLNCKIKNTTVAVCPVAFGEISVKSRIKNTLSYKKPAMWVIVTAVAVSLIASGCLLTNPKAEEYTTRTTIAENTEAETYPTTQTLTETQRAEIEIPHYTEITTEPVETQAVFTYSEPVVYEPYTEPETQAVTQIITEAVTSAPVIVTGVTEPVTEFVTEALAEGEEYYYYEFDEEENEAPRYQELAIPD
ncbi:MAG: hypothetical protein IKK10_04005 [Clostridia bacterium]|nr:hypothetical protein [Clostridia bacterium]